MASKEIEQQVIEHQVEEKFAQVKQELAELKVAIEKQNKAALQKEQSFVLKEHEETELYIEKKDANTKKSLAFEQGKSNKVVPPPKKQKTLDVTPGAHTVVEL
jgi:hypothetical protein